MTNETRVVPVDLKPCPFCGKQPKRVKSSGDERNGYADRVEYVCECGCRKGAIGRIDKPGYADNSKVEQEALEAWNTRTQPAAPVTAQEPMDELRDIRISQLSVAIEQSSKAQLENYHMATRAWTENMKLRAQLTERDALLSAIASWTTETRDAVLESFQDELNEGCSFWDGWQARAKLSGGAQ